MKVLVILPGFIPSTIIGVMRPLAMLESQGEIEWRLRLYNFQFLVSRDIDWCDVAVFCRNCETKDLPVLYELKRKGKRIVYEVDDNFEEISLSTDVGIYHRAFYRLHVLKRFFALSDVTRVYSDRLASIAKGHGACIQLNRSYFDASIIAGLSKRAADGMIRIAYPTGRIDDNGLEDQIFSAIKMILEKHSGKVEFHLWRQSVPRQLLGVGGVVLNKGVKGYENFIRSFFQTGFDIGIAPGVDAPFFHSKTNNKYREFGGCGIAGIYSNFHPYSNSVTHEQSGLLAGNSIEEWATSIDRLIVDGELRSKIARRAAEDVFQRYSFESAVQSWRDCLALVSSKIPEAPKWIPSSIRKAIYGAILLNPEERLSRRFQYLLSALKRIRGASISRFTSVSEFCASPIRNNHAAVILFVSDMKELLATSEIFDLASSVIIDLTTFADDATETIRHFQSLGAKIHITLVCNVQQSASLVLLPKDQFDVIIIDIEKTTKIDQEYTLGGYPAAYLEALERHIKFSNQLEQLVWRDRFFVLSHKIQKKYELLKGRFDTVIVLLKWHLGARRF